MGSSQRQGLSKRCTCGHILQRRYNILIVMILSFVMVIINIVAFSVLMRKDFSTLTRILQRGYTRLIFHRKSTNVSIDTTMKHEDAIQFSIDIPKNISLKEFYFGHCLNIVNSSDIVIPKEDLLHKMSNDELSCLLQRYVTTLQTFCSEPRRVGKVSNGGVNICLDHEVAPTKGCVIYSYDHHLSKLFTRQMNAHFKCATIFFGKDISTHFFRDVGGFNKILETHGNDSSILILKMESRDFKHFLNFPGIIDRFAIKQVILEIYYDIEKGSKADLFDILSALRNLLDIKYYVYWFDRNRTCDNRVIANNKTTPCFTINMMRSFKRNGNVYLQKIDIPNNIPPLGGEHVGRGKLLKYQDIYLNYISKHQILCKQSVRLGINQDGSREVCHDVPFRPRSTCIVYSFGRSNDLSFEEDIERSYGCEVSVFNPSINLTYSNTSIHIKVYHFEIGVQNGVAEFDNITVEFRTLKTIEKDLRHTNKRIDVLNIDVGDNEKQALPEMISSGALNNVAQINAIFRHYYDVGTLRKLHEIGFRIFRTRQTPQTEYYVKHRSFSYDNEVHFVNINIPRLNF